MSILKPLGFTDVSLNTREVQKNWEIDRNLFEQLKIGFKTFTQPDSDTSPEEYNEENRTYRSVQHLYYSNYLNENNVVSGSFENYLQTSLETTVRTLEEKGQVLSIPKDVFGNTLIPGSIQITDNRLFVYSEEFSAQAGEDKEITHNLSTPFPFVTVYDDEDEQVIPEKVEIGGDNSIKLNFNKTFSGKVVVLSSDRVDIRDTKSGKLINKLDDKKITGDVIYTHGNIIIQGEEISITIPENIEFENQVSVELEHNLDDLYPLLQVYSSSDEQIIPTSIITFDENRYTATFPKPVSGTLIAGRSIPEFNHRQTVDLNEETAPYENINIKHNLGTEEIIVQVFDIDGTRELIIPKKVKIDDEDTIEISFAETDSKRFQVIVYTGEEVDPNNPLTFPSPNGQLLLTSSYTLNTLKSTCKVLPKEFNFTNNPSGKNIQDNDDFSPYITTVGLYNDLNQLIAVGKLSKPIPKSDKITTTFEISIDI